VWEGYRSSLVGSVTPVVDGELIVDLPENILNNGDRMFKSV